MKSAIDDAARILGPRGRRDAPFGAPTTYRVGGTAAVSFTIEAEGDLELAAPSVAAIRHRTPCARAGSNTLVADSGFAGLVVMLGERFARVEVEESAVRAGGAASLPVLARTPRRRGSAGSSGRWACLARSAVRCA